MNAENLFWDEWKKYFCRLGIQTWVASILEFAGPFSLIGAQLLWIGAPFLYSAVPPKQLDAFSHLLEDPTQKQAFANYLRESQ
jgi:hypothetical protein